jgi:predicted dehydrogenase
MMIDAFAATGESAGRGDGESFPLEPADRDARWSVHLTSAGLRVDPENPGCDLALRGSASDLELLLYHRPTIGRIEVVGDERALDAWYRAFHFS